MFGWLWYLRKRKATGMGSYLRNHDVKFEPIEQWIGQPTAVRQRSRFKTSLPRTLDLLDRELWALDADGVVLQVYLDRSRIRLDGAMRTDAKPSQPGVILSFASNKGNLMYPCDTFDTWTDNLRAIALALESLRAVDRYGVTTRGEQYRGWQRLPSPNGPTINTKQQALDYLGRINGCVYQTLVGRELIAAVIRQAQAKTHPDKGGTAEQFKLVMECEKVLLA